MPSEYFYISINKLNLKLHKAFLYGLTQKLKIKTLILLISRKQKDVGNKFLIRQYTLFLLFEHL